jgi:hypothetical protein
MTLAPACGKQDRAPAKAPAEEPAPADGGQGNGLRLVVLVVIDQLPSWSFDQDVPYLEGGLARIIRTGIFWPGARYPYANTYTSPGHATLSTGAPPSVTRILGNHWYRRDTGAEVSSIDAELAVDGVADVLRTARGGKARSVALGLKDRGVLFAAGRSPDVAVWYDGAAMTTGGRFPATPPKWLVDWNAAHPVQSHLADEWTPLDAALLERMTGNPDDAPGEAGEDGLDATFPHPLKGLATAGDAVTLTPSGTDYMIDATLAAIAGEQLGEDGVADLLALTFSGHDYAGHAWGQRSWERTDLLLRLDRSLAGLLDALDTRVGAGKWALILTSDHGAAPMVEQQRGAAHRLGYDQLAGVADAAAARALGKPGPWAIETASGTIYTSAAFAKLPAADRARATDAMVAALRKVPGVAWADAITPLLARCGTDKASAEERAACLSIAPDLSGDLFVWPAPGSILGGDKYKFGTTHGSGNPTDTMVPIALLVPGLTPRRDPSPISPLRVAPTLSKLLGIPAPPAAKEPPLF